jgi:hypothetical protein
MNREQRDTCSAPEQASNAGLSVRRGQILTLASVRAVPPVVTGFPRVCSQAKTHPIWPDPGNGLRGVAGRQPVRGAEGACHVLG